MIVSSAETEFTVDYWAETQYLVPNELTGVIYVVYI